MAKRQLNRLVATQLNRLPQGMHADGGNLWLQVSPAGTRSWSFRFTVHGKQREMGLGPLHTVGLAEARSRAAAARLQLLDGIDPIKVREENRAAQALAATKVKTFKECAEAYIAAHTPGWSDKHAAQWPSTMRDYAYPVFGDTSVQKVDRELVLRVLKPIWLTKTDTATKVRQRIERILDWARVQGFRSGENPALLKGNLEHDLPKRSKVAKKQNHPALAHSELPNFMAELNNRDSTSAQALKFMILTAARTSEVREAEWPEIDFEAKVWVRPAHRMKAAKEHTVPLTDAAIAILETMKGRDKQFIFPGGKAKTSLSQAAMAELLKGLNGDPARYKDKRSGRAIVPHGFRSTFRDWASEETSHAREVAELALAHEVGNAVELAYRRGELLAKRRALMEDWADFCASLPATADDGDEPAVERAAELMAKTGKSPNESARLVVDALNAASDFAGIDLGGGPVPAPPSYLEGSTPLYADQLDPEAAAEELEWRQAQHKRNHGSEWGAPAAGSVDPGSLIWTDGDSSFDTPPPPPQLETRLHSNDATVRRIARKAEKRATKRG